jgi:hypothetical protein
MGFAKKRVGKDGETRYTAVYLDLRGSERSAGTYASAKAADRAWQKAEVELRQARVGRPGPRPPDVPEVRRGTMAAQPRARAHDAREIYVLPGRTYHSRAWPDAYDRHLP